VPFDGTYSKVGHDPTKAAFGTRKNQQGLQSGFAGRAPLVMTRQQIDRAANQTEENPARTAVQSIRTVQGSTSLLLMAERSRDHRMFTFVAEPRDDGRFTLGVLTGNFGTNLFAVMDRVKNGDGITPLQVMTSNEVGAGMPMTGDYDLFAVCPSWESYGTATTRDITKPGIRLQGVAPHRQPRGQTFEAGTGLDKVLDPRLHTQGQSSGHGRPPNNTQWDEHPDMGNLTPRLLRCINALNAAMAGPPAMRRVHHNAESHRSYRFGAITGDEMRDSDEGFPLTLFQPQALGAAGPTARYRTICTLESYGEFETYCSDLAAAGFYVPKNWVWRMPWLWRAQRAVFER